MPHYETTSAHSYDGVWRLQYGLSAEAQSSTPNTRHKHTSGAYHSSPTNSDSTTARTAQAVVSSPAWDDRLSQYSNTHDTMARHDISKSPAVKHLSKPETVIHQGGGASYDVNTSSSADRDSHHR